MTARRRTPRRRAPRSGAETVVVVPCYNEADRLDADRFLQLAHQLRGSLLFVNDGSTDGTGSVLRELCRRAPESLFTTTLARNRGKGEAVRYGMSKAAQQGASIVGFMDADLATPPGELCRLRQELDTPGVDVVIAARVALAGTDIVRRPARHYLGRVFSTGASLVLRTIIYDTQCGAKLFRVTAELRRALSEPFIGRWAFDVELLGRLIVDSSRPGRASVVIREIPLLRWHHKAGSKLLPHHGVRAFLDLARIELALRARRRTG